MLLNSVRLFSLFVLTMAAAFGCSQAPSTDENPVSETPTSVAIDAAAAKSFSDSVVEDFLKDDRASILSKLEAQAREQFGEKGVNAAIDTMVATYGKPLSAEFKKDEVGRKTGTAGYDKPMRKFWYVVETTKHPKGNHFIFVEIVPDGTSIASSGFAIVTFPLGVPPDMK